jgi:predicted GH43/DUF377 family glycosyl hydrolase
MKIQEKLLLKPEDFSPYFKNWRIEGIFNPAAIRRKDGKIILLVRTAERFFSKNKLEYPLAVAGKKFRFKVGKINKYDFFKQEGNMLLLKNNTYRLSNISHFRQVVLNENGFDVEEIKQEPCFFPTEEYEEFGVEDPRIVKLNKDYLMSYVSVSRKNGISSSIAVSRDLLNWKKKGIAFSHQNKDVVLFPEKINGQYVALTRPVGNFNFSKPSIGISYSKDLEYWGKERLLFSPRKNSWEEDRIGAGCPPIKTPRGWLLIYHGVKNKVYSAGAVLLDLKNPSQVMAQSPKSKPLFYPRQNYEKQGFIHNVVFPTGIIQDDKNNVLIYSGTADKFITVKKIKINEILGSLKKCK